MKSPGEQSVQPVGNPGQDKSSERQEEFLIEKQRDKHRHESHPKDGQQIRNGDDA
jgi:hypothetical protein